MSPIPHDITASADRLGLAMGRALDPVLEDLPQPVRERLRVARDQALRHHARAIAQSQVVMAQSNGALVLGTLRGHWLGRLGVWGLVLAMASALVLIDIWQDEARARELADVDVAVLTDELPPAAYADPGFAQFLKANLRNNP